MQPEEVPNRNLLPLSQVLEENSEVDKCFLAVIVQDVLCLLAKPLGSAGEMSFFRGRCSKTFPTNSSSHVVCSLAGGLQSRMVGVSAAVDDADGNSPKMFRILLETCWRILTSSGSDVLPT